MLAWLGVSRLAQRCIILVIVQVGAWRGIRWKFWRALRTRKT